MKKMWYNFIKSIYNGGKVMKKYILKRTVWLVLTFIACFIITYFIYTQLVGTILDVDALTQKKISRNITKLVERYNLNKSNFDRFIIICKKLFTNKLELYSLDIRDKPMYIMPFIFKKMKTNLLLIFSVMIFGSAVSVPLGIRFSKVKKSKVLALIMYFCMSIPGYVLAAVIFSKYKTSSFFGSYMASHSTTQVDNFNGNLREYVIPFITLSIMYISQCTKRTKVTISEIKEKEFITTAYAYGCSRRQVEYKYVLKNALPSIITFSGSYFSLLFSELIVVQTALGSNGLGAFFLSMVNERQYDAVFGCVVFIIAVASIFNYLVDILYFVIDPRIKIR